MKSWLEISGPRLAENYKKLAEAAGAGTSVLAVVKANAYGHGLALCAPVLAEAGVDWLGVTDVNEGKLIRRVLLDVGMPVEAQPRVLVMCGLTEDEAEEIVFEELTPVIWRLEQMEWLASAAERLISWRTFPVHVEVDTGMSRQGARPGEELRVLLDAIRDKKALRLDGLMTHFASAEVSQSPQTAGQRREFEHAIKDAAELLALPGYVCVGNTSGLDLVDETEEMPAWAERMAEVLGSRVLVRTGLGLYGYSLPLEPAVGSRTVISRLDETLQPVMTWKTKVIGVSEIGPGDAVGYNGTFVAQRPMRLALLGVGYADGLRRELSSTNERAGGWVMVRGQRAPIVGRVSMNLTTVDVTEIEGVVLGEEVVVLGDGVTAQDHARLAGAIAYEIVCGVKAPAKLVD